MMNDFEKKRAEFDGVFAGLHEECRRISAEVKKYDQGLNDNLDAFQKVVSSSGTRTGLKADNPLTQLFGEIRTIFASKCGEWVEGIRQSQKNLAFRDKLKEHVLIYVYGKVKSGKSSLGNFAAYGAHNPAVEETKKHDEIVFNVEQLSELSADDKAKFVEQLDKARNEKKFGVDFFEATACIQYFKKPGLAWIDSPGIHSKTEANGKLAKEYLESADLVIYTMSSRSAARDSDRKEIVEIIKSRKPFLLVGTRCDEKDKDIVDGKIVDVVKMFSPKDREEVRKFCIKSISEDLGEYLTRDVARKLEENTITLSCKYGEEHPDSPQWEESGMAEFYRRLIAIGMGEGARQKMEAPRKILLNHIRIILESLDELRRQIDRARIELVRLNNKLRTRTTNLKLEAYNELKRKLDDLADRHYGDDELFREKALQAGDEILNEATGRLLQEFAENSVTLVKGMPIAGKLGKIKTFEDITQEVSYQTSGKRGWGSVLGAVVGGAAGFFVGGPAGAALGAGLGSTVGAHAGSHIDNDACEIRKVGDNRGDVARDMAQHMKPLVEELIQTKAGDLSRQCLEPLEKWFKNSETGLNNFEAFLKSEKSGLEATLGGR